MNVSLHFKKTTPSFFNKNSIFIILALKGYKRTSAPLTTILFLPTRRRTQSHRQRHLLIPYLLLPQANAISTLYFHVYTPPLPLSFSLILVHRLFFSPSSFSPLSLCNLFIHPSFLPSSSNTSKILSFSPPSPLIQFSNTCSHVSSRYSHILNLLFSSFSQYLPPLILLPNLNFAILTILPSFLLSFKSLVFPLPLSPYTIYSTSIFVSSHPLHPSPLSSLSTPLLLLFRLLTHSTDTPLSL